MTHAALLPRRELRPAGATLRMGSRRHRKRSTGACGGPTGSPRRFGWSTILRRRPPLLARGATPDSSVQEGRGRRVPLAGDAPGAMPTNGGNGHDVSVVGEGSGPDAKAARPAESPRWTAGRGPGVGPGPGVGVVGHSRELLRELLRGALVYAAPGVPVFPCEPGARNPSRRTASWRRPPTRRSYAGGGPGGRTRSLGDPHRGALWTTRPRRGRGRRHGLGGPARALPRPASQDGKGSDGRGRGCISTYATLPYKSFGRGPVHAAGEEQPGASRGRPGRARREGTSPATPSWYRPAARHAPTGGWTGRPRWGRLAARVSEGGYLRRDPVLKSGPGGLR